MYCKNCGKEINSNSSYCPNCGNRVNKTEPTHNNDTNPSLVLAIISCVLFWFPIISIPLAIISIILAIINKKNRLASIIISIISILLTILEIALIVFALSTIKSTVPNNIEDRIKRIIEEEPTTTKTDIKGYSWDNQNKEIVYFNNDYTYKWYIDDNPKEGTYNLYNGEAAINYISRFLEEFNITEKDQKNIIEEYKTDLNNYYLLILNQKEDNKTLYYYGIINDDNLSLIDITNQNKIELTRKEKINNTDI